MSGKKIIACVAVLFILAVICSIVSVGAYLYYQNSRPAEFVLIKESGKVSYKTGDEYKELTETQINLPDKSFVKTGNGSAHILLPDNSLLTLDTNTEIQVKIDSAGINVMQLTGNTWNRVQKVINDQEYTVTTPNIIAAVRGTIFSVRADKSVASSVAVIDQSVEVNLDEQTETVSADETATLLIGEGFSDPDFTVAATDSEFKDSTWYLKNSQLDSVWKQFDRNSGREEILKKLVKVPAALKDVPQQVSSFLAQSDLDELNKSNFSVNPGFNPPNIEGTFRIDKWTVKSDKMGIYPVGKLIDTCDYTFSNQSSEGDLSVGYECTNDIGTGTGGFISGNNSCFTIYINQSGTYLSCNYSMPAIITGCIDDIGLTELQYAVVMKSKDNTQACEDNMMPVGNIRTISIDDLHADRI